MRIFVKNNAAANCHKAILTMNRGRSQSLIQERNRKIAELYFQLEPQLRNYSDVVKALSRTFFLSEYRIQAIIRQMIRNNTFVAGEPMKPMRKTRKHIAAAPIQVCVQLSLF